MFPESPLIGGWSQRPSSQQDVSDCGEILEALPAVRTPLHATTAWCPGVENHGMHVDGHSRQSYFPAMRFRVLVEPDEDGVFVAQCPVLPGCVSQGQTRDEALQNIKDAIGGYLASLEKHQEPVPSPITEELVDVPA